MSAAAASRDITLLHAMEFLHQHNYDIGKAVCSLVPPNGPVLCRDEMEEWSASEANLFEEALEKYGKDFNDIRQDFVSFYSSFKLIFAFNNYSNITFNITIASVEKPKKSCRILLYVENNR
jgi:metastasis-associated protein MTA